MQIKTNAIVLNALRYQEKSLIVKSFTKDFGLKTYFIQNAFSKRNKNLNSAYFQPLNQLHLDAVHKNKGSMENIREIKLAYAYQTIPFDFYKNNVGIFLAEVLSNSIKEEQADNGLYLFIETALIWFDEHDFNADFHLWFLLNLSKYLGFYPDDSRRDADYFNPREGNFTSTLSADCFNESETALFHRLLHLSVYNQAPIFKNEERRRLLELLLRYYSIHIAGFRQIKSLEILPELFR